MQAANDNIDARQQKLRDAMDANAAFNDEICRTIDLLDQVARATWFDPAAFQGLRRAISAAYRVKAAHCFQQLAGTSGVTDNGRMVHRLGEEFHKALDRRIGESWPDTINLFQGAATGLWAGGISCSGARAANPARLRWVAYRAFEKILLVVDGVGGQILGALCPYRGFPDRWSHRRPNQEEQDRQGDIR